MPRLDQGEAAKARQANLFLIATGTLSTAHLPFWLNWLSVNRPHYKVTVGLTDSAEHFVSASALTAVTGTPVVANTWETAGRREAVHTRIAADYGGIIVFPASVAFLSGLASGSGTSPFFLAALGTSAPVVIAPSFPPGVAGNPIIAGVLARLNDVPNYHLVETRTGTSRSTGAEAEAAPPFWDVIATFEEATDVAPDSETATAPVNA
ncbi:flavoprotein [Streptomyces sp. NPDC048723]|uniref:flavoprotein n=1 Tax=Streptomyces sp. NPDC048723 TaxID=3365589 RepID=UPI0037198941